MDCRQALEILDVARPGSSDLSDPELAEAAAHIQSHDDCRNEFARRQQLDRQIGTVMRDVPVPSDLKARLLTDIAAATEEDPTISPIDAAKQTKTPQSRRAWLQRAMVSAACVAAAVICWQVLPGNPKPFDIDVLPTKVADSLSKEGLDFDKLAPFVETNDGSPMVPAVWDDARQRGLSLSGPKSYQLSEGTDETVAIYQFRFPHRGATVTGYLLVLPLEQSTNTPNATGLLGSAGTAATRMAAQSWTSKQDKLVYICIVPRGDNFDTLWQLVQPRSA